MDVTDIRECNGDTGTQWLLTLTDGRGVWVHWVGQSLLAKASETTIRELWSLEFSKQDNQIIAVYLPDELRHDWAATRPYIERKLKFLESL